MLASRFGADSGWVRHKTETERTGNGIVLMWKPQEGSENKWVEVVV